MNISKFIPRYLCRRLLTARAQPTTIIKEEIAINIIKVVGEGFENKKEIVKNIHNGYYICSKMKLIHDRSFHCSV